MTWPDRSLFVPHRRRALPWALLAVVTLAAVLLLPGRWTDAPAPEADDQVLASVPLTAADAGSAADAPLFTVTRMAPGHRFERCVVIASSSAGAAVRFAVGGVSGALAPWLRIDGTTGTGTSRDCGDFAADGAAFYTGSLAALSSAGLDGVPTGWIPQRAERRTFRLAVEVADDARAAGVPASATLIWRLPSPKTAPTTAPATSRSSVPPEALAPPHATPSPSGAAPPQAAAPQPPQVTVPAPGGGMAPVVCPPAVAARIGDLLAGVARFSWLALLLLLLVLLFLALQDRVDRNDPKLAQAPLYGDPDQAFPDSGSIPWRTP